MEGKPRELPNGTQGLMKSVVALVAVLALFVALIGLAFASLPPFVDAHGQEREMYTLLPRSLEQLQEFRGMLLAYTEDNYMGVLLVFSLLYVFKQTFSIPGSVLMNVVGGALLGLSVGFPLCCLLSAVGASCCFWLSHFIGEPVISRIMGGKLRQLRSTIVTTDSLLLYLIFIRIFPITPNWAINLASPLIHVPFLYFFLSVFLGLMPYNFITVNAGTLVQELNSMKDVMSRGTIIQLAAVSALLLTSILVKNYLSKQAALGKAKVS